MKPTVIILGALMVIGSPAYSHDIYSDLRTKDNTWHCCGGPDAGPGQRDCWRTVYREAGDTFEFRTQDNDWVRQPIDRIQFIPIPGDVVSGGHDAHLCYRYDHERADFYRTNGFSRYIFQTVSGKEIIVYCAVIPPGGT